MTFLSFDIEISDVFDVEPGQDIESFAPFHVSVAASIVNGGEERLWYSEESPGHPALNLTPAKAREMLDYLEEMQNRGLPVVAWNGLKFDFKWLGYQAGDLAHAARIALKSYDPFFQFFNQRGFFLSLAKVAEGLGVPIRKSMDGAEAPRAWRQGRFQEVMDYVLGDCRITNHLVLAIKKRGGIAWVNRRGELAFERFERFKKVEEVLSEPPPDTSWMDDPPDKREFARWIETLQV
jgi:hypothetical protein